MTFEISSKLREYGLWKMDFRVKTFLQVFFWGRKNVIEHSLNILYTIWEFFVRSSVIICLKNSERKWKPPRTTLTAYGIRAHATVTLHEFNIICCFTSCAEQKFPWNWLSKYIIEDSKKEGDYGSGLKKKQNEEILTDDHHKDHY